MYCLLLQVAVEIRREGGGRKGRRERGREGGRREGGREQKTCV